MAAETMPPRDAHTGLVHSGPGHVARGYSWPPFEKENWAALKHGAESPRMIRPLAEQFEAELVKVAPWTDRPAFRDVRESWAWARAQLLLLRAWIDERGELDATAERAMDLEHRIESRLTKLRASLGLDAVALGKLMASMATLAAAGGDTTGLEAVKAEGRAIVASREAQISG